MEQLKSTPSAAMDTTLSEDAESRKMTVERLEEFRAAWARSDLDGLMALMADDCVYRASVGPEPGEEFVGRGAVREGFARMLAHDGGKEGRNGPCFVYGNRGVAHWSYVYFEGDRRIEVCGCDLFDFAGDKIRVKDAFRKTFCR